MTKRKFTPPTEFPAEYVDADGNKMVVLGMSHAEVYPFIGFDANGRPVAWTQDGELLLGSTFRFDLHDIPKRITAWHNVYRGREISYPYSSREGADRHSSKRRLCVWRIEGDEDGGNPEIFVEEV